MTTPLTLGGSLDLLLPITALLPLTAVLLVSQGNPYQTLVLRGILGSVATLLYALLGAPDVALTEALVGTLLSTTLYAIALRSSMALRLEDRRLHPQEFAAEQELNDWLAPLHLRLRLRKDTEAIHGWLDDGRRLVLRGAALRARLQSCRGYDSWLSRGGDVMLVHELSDQPPSDQGMPSP
jgi:putative multicomponent Na+:H+ antiporter subunit B